MGDKVMIDMAKVDALVEFVREWNTVNNAGCPKGVMQHVGKYPANIIAFAHSAGRLETRKGRDGGSWPAGEMPAAKDDGAPSITAQAFDLLLAFSRGEQIDPKVARDLWDAREALNAQRRKA